MAQTAGGLPGIDHPVLAAPMGGICGGRLAAAVSSAGGLGLIGGGYADARLGYGSNAWINSQFDEAADVPVGIGFITWSLAANPGALACALARKPAAVMLSFGDETLFAADIKASGAQLICQVQDVPGALRARAAGADVIVAQGSEAGGHGCAGRALFALLPAVVDAVAPVPVAAAGGIADGRGLAAALALGAAGVMAGTRFWATPEALGSAAAKAALITGTGSDTVRTRVFDMVRQLDWPEGYSGRALINRFTRRWHGNEQALRAGLADEIERYKRAVLNDDVAETAVFAGEGLDMIRAITPAAQIVADMVATAKTP